MFDQAPEAGAIQRDDGFTLHTPCTLALRRSIIARRDGRERMPHPRHAGAGVFAACTPVAWSRLPVERAMA